MIKTVGKDVNAGNRIQSEIYSVVGIVAKSIKSRLQLPYRINFYSLLVCKCLPEYVRASRRLIVPVRQRPAPITFSGAIQDPTVSEEVQKLTGRKPLGKYHETWGFSPSAAVRRSLATNNNIAASILQQALVQ